MSRHFAVVGSPIEHSLSPALHRAAFDYLEVDADYQRFEVASSLREFLENQVPALDGVSVTMPLKEEALGLAIEVDSVASLTGACNTLVRIEGGWAAHNTDVIGLKYALGESLAGRVLILGSGATSRSALAACSQAGVRVETWARNGGKLSAAQASLFNPAASKEVSEYDLVISTIPISALDHLLTESTSAPKLLFSASYGLSSNRLEGLAAQGKLIDGREMLLWQAVAQQAIFNGTKVSEFLANEGLVKAMRNGLARAVGE
jgi:shikimate dehydrogenase